MTFINLWVLRGCKTSHFKPMFANFRFLRLHSLPACLAHLVLTPPLPFFHLRIPRMSLNPAPPALPETSSSPCPCSCPSLCLVLLDQLHSHKSQSPFPCHPRSPWLHPSRYLWLSLGPQIPQMLQHLKCQLPPFALLPLLAEPLPRLPPPPGQPQGQQLYPHHKLLIDGWWSRPLQPWPTHRPGWSGRGLTAMAAASTLLHSATLWGRVGSWRLSSSPGCPSPSERPRLPVALWALPFCAIHMKKCPLLIWGVGVRRGGPGRSVAMVPYLNFRVSEL